MGSVIVGGARTPIGKLLGGLKDVSTTDLGGYAIAAALDRSNVALELIDYGDALIIIVPSDGS
jgi:acetyl-CoA C-acetyltransferase